MARGRWPIGQCRVCLGWGELPQFADCAACSPWRRKYPGPTRCRRCRHPSHVNTDGLCRLCLLTIRTEDPGWITDPRPGRSCQLGLILPGVRLPRAQPLNRPLRGKPPDRTRPWSWLERVRIDTAQPIDAPFVCPPAAPGQLALLRLRRRLTDDHELLIRDRDLRGQDATKAASLGFAAERGWTRSMAYWLARMARLALAVRDADGEVLVPEDVLDDLPHFSEHVAEVLRRTGLLGPRRHRLVVADNPARARGCSDCDCWGVHAHPRCSACQQWKFGGQRPVGDCSRCQRVWVPLRDGRCRACTVHVNERGPVADAEPWTQLWFGGELALRLQQPCGALGYVVPHHRGRQRAAARRAAPRPVSAHLIDPAQGTLFDGRRDWSCIPVGSLDRLPCLTPAAQALLNDFQRYARERHWDEQLRRLTARTLRIVLAWVGADAPIPEADVRALPVDRPGTNARRAVQFLADRGLLIPDPAREEQRNGIHR